MIKIHVDFITHHCLFVFKSQSFIIWGVSVFPKMGKMKLRAVVEYLFLRGINTQEIHINMGKISMKNALIFARVTK